MGAAAQTGSGEGGFVAHAPVAPPASAHRGCPEEARCVRCVRSGDRRVHVPEQRNGGEHPHAHERRRTQAKTFRLSVPAMAMKAAGA